MVYWISTQTGHEFDFSTCHNKNTIGEEATGNHFINSTFLESSELSLVSASLENEYAMEVYHSTIGEEGNGKPPPKFHFPK